MNKTVTTISAAQFRRIALGLVVAAALVVVLVMLLNTAHGPAGATTATTKPLPADAYTGPPLTPPTLPPVGPPLPTSTPAGLCGPWSGATNPTIASMIQNHGEIRNCLEVGNNWVLLFVAGPSPADVAVLHCVTGDIACISGSADLSARPWVWLTPPTSPQPDNAYAYAVGLLSVDHSNNTLLIDANGAVLTFDPTADTFTPLTQG
jgi:hypothetical protein